jgi:hypothetical protein
MLVRRLENAFQNLYTDCKKKPSEISVNSEKKNMGGTLS